MFAFTAEWLNLLIRWAHMVVGIGWIGASFYFIGLDVSLKKREKMNPGVYGTAWEVHGGGFYHVEKYLVAPEHLPDDLIWYKWEAYLTFLTGFALLIVQYYLNPTAFLIDPAVAQLYPWQAIMISVLGLAAGWFIYDRLCRSSLGKNTVSSRSVSISSSSRRLGPSRMCSRGAARSSMWVPSPARSWRRTSLPSSSEPEEDRREPLEGREARSALRGDRQAAFGAQHLSDAAGPPDDGVEPLCVPHQSSAVLAACRADLHRRRDGAPLLRPARGGR